jgi:hypothetical protein
VGKFDPCHYHGVFLKSPNDQRAKMPLIADEPMSAQYDIQEVLDRIRHVIHNDTVPSWLGSVPSNFGEKAAGMIKVDEWRTLATVYLLIALVSLWGMTGPQSNIAPDLRTVLDHTMDLISAVYLACAHTTSNNRAIAYQNYIARYVGNLKAIYPTFSARPNHHASFHIYNYLVLFGPVYSWWSFPFERLIGTLQRLPKNHRSGWSLCYLMF